MARVIIYHSRARRQTNAEAAKFLRGVLREIAFNARLHVSHGPYTNGNLARSIEATPPRVSFGLVQGEVGSNLHYAAAVEEGAIPHLIAPRPPKRYLRFYWRKVGRVVHPDLVRHPGQRGKRYLTRAAEAVARRHNMIWYSRDI